MTTHRLVMGEQEGGALRSLLLKRVNRGDLLEVEWRPLTFSQTRAWLAVINTVAWERHCRLRYSEESHWAKPPLVARYTHPPRITAARP